MSRTTVGDLFERYRAGTPLTSLTAYDAPTARLVDGSGVDMILVGDSAGNVQLGYDSTLPVTLEEALSNTAAVSRAVSDAMVIGDMPFLSYGTSMEASVHNAGRFLKEADADAVKLETAPHGDTTIDIIDRLTELGIPVQGHIGYTPQREHELGGAVIQGSDRERSANVDDLVTTAERLVNAGVFSLVVETVTERTAKAVTEAIDVPTIGIGAGRYVDGQVLVINDVIGLGGSQYTFTKQYADLDRVIADAVEAYVEDVRSGAFPTEAHAFEPLPDATQ